MVDYYIDNENNSFIRHYLSKKFINELQNINQIQDKQEKIQKITKLIREKEKIIKNNNIQDGVAIIMHLYDFILSSGQYDMFIDVYDKLYETHLLNKEKQIINSKTHETTKKKIVIFCDGTWCGEQTGTNTNIKILADLMTNQDCKDGVTYNIGDICICYFQGIGISGSFIDYLINGATALDIKKYCIDVYKFIVDNFEIDSEIWMFGLSRGAYTVRCVAGMINNCGIINKTKIGDDDIIYYEEIYKIYRSRDPEDNPNSIGVNNFKRKFSYNTNKPPIKFMGLLDTVGSLGIPKINPGVYLDYEEFYDQNVSGEVQNVYQAVSIHDRFSLFEPCFVRRLKKDKEFIYNNGKNENSIDFINYNTKEVWFPGAHYDIGRQRFVFTRSDDIPWESLLNNVINHFNIFVIEPTYKYSNYVLEWMINSINENDTDGTQKLFQKLNYDFETSRPISILERISLLNNRPLKGDVYNNIINMLEKTMIIPYKYIFISFNKQILRDRRIIPYKNVEFCNDYIEECAINELQNPDNYLSKTYITYERIKNILNQS
jgi:hypothetical protein